MMNARLSELTLRADPPFVQAGTDRGIFVRTKEAATLMALVTEQGIERGLEALVTESARAARFGFTAAELEREKRDTLRGYENAFAERDKEESADLAAEYIRNFISKEPLPGITYEFGLVQRFIPEITLEEVNKVAKDWTAGSRVVLVNAPQKPGLAVPSETKLAAAIKAASERDIRPYVDVDAHAAADRDAAEARRGRAHHDQAGLRRHRVGALERRARRPEADDVQAGRGDLPGDEPRRHVARERRGLRRGDDGRARSSAPAASGRSTRSSCGTRSPARPGPSTPTSATPRRASPAARRRRTSRRCSS